MNEKNYAPDTSIMLKNMNLQNGENPSLSAKIIGGEPVFGCFGLDAAGMILYSRIESEKYAEITRESLVGQNFFENLLKFENAGELKSYFTSFIKSDEPTKKFVFDCRLKNGGAAQTNILLTRINEREFAGNRNVVIVDIRKVWFGNFS